ncbi:MAG: hypothetical protein EOP04_33310 [Proteobacteria bacterium]|nr:MAG: hypothetical protein EOP04_33310 [Pseudomonadota bacterium]
MIMRNDAPDEIGEFLDSPDHLRIIILADSKTGTNEDEVERKFGESSLAYFEDLKDSDVLRHRNGSWYFDGNLHASSMPQTRKIFSTIMMSCDRRNDKIPNASYSGFGWESVNHETLEKLYEMEERHDKERFALVSKPESKGNILAVYGSFLNVLKGLLEKTK